MEVGACRPLPMQKRIQVSCQEDILLHELLKRITTHGSHHVSDKVRTGKKVKYTGHM